MQVLPTKYTIIANYDHLHIVYFVVLVTQWHFIRIILREKYYWECVYLGSEDITQELATSTTANRRNKEYLHS